MVVAMVRVWVRVSLLNEDRLTTRGYPTVRCFGFYSLAGRKELFSIKFSG